MRQRKAVFLDRDGVINYLVYHKKDRRFTAPLLLREFRLISGISYSIKALQENGFLVIVVSNQPDIARGRLSLFELNVITKEMYKRLADKGAYLDGVYYCLHHPDFKKAIVKKYCKNCNCRKPKIGLFLKAARNFSINFSHSWMIGDTLWDMKAGENAGCKTILIYNSKTDINESENKPVIKPNFIIKGPKDILKIILKNK